MNTLLNPQFPFYCFSTNEEEQLRELKDFLVVPPSLATESTYRRAEKNPFIKDILKSLGFSSINKSRKKFFKLHWESGWNDSDWENFFNSICLKYIYFISDKRNEICYRIKDKLWKMSTMTNSNELDKKCGPNTTVSIPEWNLFAISSLPEILDNIINENLNDDEINLLEKLHLFQMANHLKLPVKEFDPLKWIVFLTKLEELIDDLDPQKALPIILGEISIQQDYNILANFHILNKKSCLGHFNTFLFHHSGRNCTTTHCFLSSGGFYIICRAQTNGMFIQMFSVSLFNRVQIIIP